MKKNILFLLLFLSIFLQTSITTIPIVLDVILIFYILNRKSWVFLLAFASGIFLDSLTVRSLGQSSIFFLSFLFIATLYERKFEIASSYFVFFASFLGSLFFLKIFDSDYIFQQAAISAIFSAFLFKGVKLLTFKNDE